MALFGLAASLLASAPAALVGDISPAQINEARLALELACVRSAIDKLDAERRHVIERGGLIVEGTAGNTGIGLALVGAQIVESLREHRGLGARAVELSGDLGGSVLGMAETLIISNGVITRDLYGFARQITAGRNAGIDGNAHIDAIQVIRQK